MLLSFFDDIFTFKFTIFTEYATAFIHKVFGIHMYIHNNFSEFILERRNDKKVHYRSGNIHI